MMRRRFRTGTAALAFLSMTEQALAGGFCANPLESTALKIAALQQELMVAALSCKETESYNRFVIAYREDLQRSDAVLEAYFMRGNPHGGTAAYNAYKTRLANDASLRSLHGIDAYCTDAHAVFDTALARHDRPLAGLVSDQPAVVAVSGTGCADGDRFARKQ